MTSINFDGHNLGFQAGVINGSVSTDNITTVRPLANSLFKSLFNSSELFGQIRNKLGLLVAVLDATKEHTQGVQAGNEQVKGLEEALANCHSTLTDLSRLKDHFDGVNPQTQATWERMGWREDDLVDLSSKLTTYINGLNVLNDNILRWGLRISWATNVCLIMSGRSSHANFDRLLRNFINEIRAGKRESSVMSSVSTGSLSTDEKEEWRQLRRELQSIGITPEIFAHNREYILDTLRALSQDEIGAAVQEQKSASEPLGDVAYGSSESESQEEKSAPKHPADVGYESSKSESQEEISAPKHSADIPDKCLESASQGDSMLLPPIRSNGTDLYTSLLLASINQTPKEKKSDEWAASIMSSKDSPVAEHLGENRRPSRSLIDFEIELTPDDPENDGHVHDELRPLSFFTVVQPSNRTRDPVRMSHDDLEPSSREEWAYILRLNDLKKKGKHSGENWSTAASIGQNYGQLPNHHRKHTTLVYSKKHTCIVQ
ncbi:uncharacterized protein N7503_000721 [Penicillium pulvis]|uniref:uncharacterized protein n=1 Tax=Penicillium pulvis TaxID=1562058 RepID=UPI0025488D7A|nr:uncharacterized protein N7503_000721 [Penicillium pulvis]KAJ5813971.1 hypothetical protein N7503_000721 [Penicillium pulvis]